MQGCFACSSPVIAIGCIRITSYLYLGYLFGCGTLGAIKLGPKPMYYKNPQSCTRINFVSCKSLVWNNCCSIYTSLIEWLNAQQLLDVCNTHYSRVAINGYTSQMLALNHHEVP